MSPYMYSAGAPLKAEMPPKDECAAFTGHRPQSLPWGRDESDPRCIALKAELSSRIRLAYSEGKRYFLSGMADGVDTYAAEAVLQLADELEGLRLIAVFPYGSGTGVRQRRIAKRAYITFSLCPQYVAGCMQARNRFLVDNCSELICVYSGGSSGGTAATMRMAAEKGIRLVVLKV